MTKERLCCQVARETGLTREQVRLVFTRIFEGIAEEVVTNGNFTINQFGKFKIVEYKNALGAFPSVAFHPHPSLKRLVRK